MKFWIFAVILGFCGTLFAAPDADAAKVAKLKEAYARFQLLWGQGKYKECAPMFAEDGGPGLALKQAMERRGIAEGDMPHESSALDTVVADGRLVGKVRTFVLVARHMGDANKSLLVLDETFSLESQDGKYKMVDYQRADVTEKTVKVLEGFIEEELKNLRNAQRPVAGRQSNGGIACDNLRVLGQPGRAWPIVKEMFDLGTEAVSDPDLMSFQGVLKELLRLEKPPEEYRELVEKILAMKPRGNQ